MAKYEPKEIANWEHDQATQTKKVTAYGWDGSSALALKVDSSGQLVISNSVPRNISISATNQSEGNLTLSDSSNWNVSHSFITSIKVTTASTDWDLWLTDATFSKVLITSRQLAANRSGNFDITVLRNYDSDTNVYLIYADNSGANTCNILINGEERRV